MKTECSIVRDLLPLYVEGLISEETAQYVREHLQGCPDCQEALSLLREKEIPLPTPSDDVPCTNSTKPFKKRIKRMSKVFYLLVYSLIIFFVFLGFSLTGGEYLMYNSLIMPIVGVFGYCVFRWKAVYKLPILLLLTDAFVWAVQLVELDLYSALVWTVIYSLFVFLGIAIAFLLHFAFKKEEQA